MYKRQEWTWFNANGYIEYVAKDWKTKVYEHRLVAEKVFSIKLNRAIHVHHVNEKRNDNRASNLRVVSNKEHATIHHGTNTRHILCCVCHKPISRRASHVKRNDSNFCSEACQHLGQRKVTRPERQELENQIATINNWREIARIYNVSDSAVRKWAKNYGLSNHKRTWSRLKVD